MFLRLSSIKVYKTFDDLATSFLNSLLFPCYMSKPRIAIAKSGKAFLVKDASKDFHTQFGFIKKADFKKSKVKTNTGKELSLFDANFIDLYKRIKRSAQLIPLKDLGSIIAQTGINKSSVVVDAGAGSGGLGCFLAHLAKKVITYDIREDFIEVVEQNKKFLGLKNLIIKKKNIYEGIDEKNIDLITLDLPEPWKALDAAAKALKHGGFVMSYSPSIPQASDFVEAVQRHDAFIHLKAIEIIEREWEFEDRKIRPKSQPIGHSGFLSFARRV